jgi:hypothetical protein
MLLVGLLHYRVPDEWSWPLFVVYVAALVACLAVQPWVRRTLTFWISLLISFVVQLCVAHWLAVYHPAYSRGQFRGSAFLSTAAGYVFGCVVFLLIQRLSQQKQADL